MARCPNCGASVSTPIKTWPIPSRKELPENAKPKLAGIFACPNCNARFRAAVEAGNGIAETASIKNVVERIRGIKGELMQTLRNLHEKIKTLETERASLMIEIANLKKVAESRSSALESEVNSLREEMQSLRELLGYSKESEN